jgi:hypothetical protein
MSTALAPPRDAMGSDLRLFVRCHEHVLAFDAAWIERILLVEEAGVLEPPAALGVYPQAPRACLGVLTAGDALWAAWDLGRLIGLPSVRVAYLLVRQPHGGRTVRLALRTDRCLHVGRLPGARLLPLPPGLARARPGLVRGAFPMEPLKLRQQGETPVGLDLDFARLWEASEIAFAQELLSRADTPAPEGDDGAA